MPTFPVVPTPGDGWDPSAYIEFVCTEVLTAQESTLHATVTDAAVLLASTGFLDAADRLLHGWQDTTASPIDAVSIGEPIEDVTQRALAVLLAARSDSPAWARSVIPADLDAAETAHRAYLERTQSSAGDMLTQFVGVAATEMLDDAACHLGKPATNSPTNSAPVDPLRTIAAAAEDAARVGDHCGARAAVHRWSVEARKRPRPPTAMLAGSRHLAPLLLAGTLIEPLGVDHRWARDCAGGLLAALTHRYPRSTSGSAQDRSMHTLVEAICASRAHPDLPETVLPRPASHDQIAEAEERIGTALPADYTEFLLVCNGLPADVVFPRLFGAHELAHLSTQGVLVISTPGPTGSLVMLLAAPSAHATREGPHDSGHAGDAESVSSWRTVEWDPVLGTTLHAGFRELLEHHLALLDHH